LDALERLLVHAAEEHEQNPTLDLRRAIGQVGNAGTRKWEMPGRASGRVTTSGTGQALRWSAPAKRERFGQVGFCRAKWDSAGAKWDSAGAKWDSAGPSGILPGPSGILPGRVGFCRAKWDSAGVPRRGRRPTARQTGRSAGTAAASP
jgi:hypothetical protein